MAAPSFPTSMIEEYLQLSTFKGKFDNTEFVSSISEKLIARSKADNEPFDPKPFIQTFEVAVDRLISLRKEVQTKTEQMEKIVRVAEREYSMKMKDLNRSFEAAGNTFSGMEGRMNDVSSTAVRIGDQLETVHVERQRAQAAYDLIDYYNQFSKGETSRLDALRKEGRAGRRQVAIILRRLNTVAKEVDLPSGEKTRENIDKYCEKFEKEMLNLFDRCYRKGDPKMMHHCAQTLLEFNGGTSCVQVYVNQHDFFINSGQKAKPSEDTVLWKSIADPDIGPPKSELGLAELFEEIRVTVDQEAQIVKAVFPNPSMVMQVFLQRVFAQSIQQCMEQLLHRGSEISELAYLRVLQMVHTQTSTLVDDLKGHELPHVSPRTPYGAIEFRRSLTSTAPIAGHAPTSINVMLESAMEELFVPYTEGQRYMERELKSLGTLYNNLLAPFTRYHKSSKAKSSMFNRVVNQINASSVGTTTSAQAAAALMRFGGMTADRKSDQLTEDPVREDDGLLSVDTAEKILKWHAEATGRCVELSPSSDVPKHTFSLLRVLANTIATCYIDEALETAHARLDVADTKTEPSFQTLAIVHSIDLICHLWQQYINTAVLPLASSSVTLRREMVVFNNQTTSRMESGANALLQRVTDSVVSWLSLQLAKQKKNDFKPRNDDVSFARANTEPCIACCDTLENVRDAARLNLSGKNLEVFLTEIGVAFNSLLLEHLRKFPVSATGGLMLAKDIKLYQETIRTFGVLTLDERFEFIRQLGNVFLVRPEILKSYITEEYLGRIDVSLLRPYLALRGDWGQFEKGFNDDDDANEMPDNSGTGSRFGRLSVMMKDLEGLKLDGLSSMAIPAMPTISTSFAGTFSIPGKPFGS